MISTLILTLAPTSPPTVIHRKSVGTPARVGHDLSDSVLLPRLIRSKHTGLDRSVSLAFNPHHTVSQRHRIPPLQVTAQDITTAMRFRQNPIIFLINNGGYTIEVEIHDGAL